ncbi:MAG: GNAT family N-acetyltransferase [Acidimicrobiales bacterium]|jgi:GNAT superfamily N-acetyltransferase|nr:GNAT family N-acetyltransferase [Acidimicrobiales bacterium]
MVREEVDLLVEWAAGEGWNPGLRDADAFWATDPDGFVAAEIDGDIVGGGSIVAYGRSYGFMGFFLVRPDRRGHGLGRELWFTRRSLLLERLEPGAAIEMDGVFAMEHFYRAGGFVAQHRDLRFTGVAGDHTTPPTAAATSVDVVDVADVPFGLIEDYDRAHFPAPRPAFLRRWLAVPGGHAVASVDDDRCRGYAVIRPARVGHRIGPLFADDAAVAEALFASVTQRVAGATVFLDVPERNADAMALVARHGMQEVFGCARMTLGDPPSLPWDEIFGVTTFEIG